MNKKVNQFQSFFPRIVFCFIALFAALCITLTSHQAALANGSAGGGYPPGGSCAPPGSSPPWYDTCYGATWRYYQYGQTSATFNGGVAGEGVWTNGNDNAPPVQITGCADVGGFYLLAYEVYNQYTLQSYGYQAGGVRMDRLIVNGATGLDATVFTVQAGSESLESVKQKFDAMPDQYKNGHTNWVGDLSWFCYSPDLVTPTPEVPPAPTGGGATFETDSRATISPQNGDVTKTLDTGWGKDQSIELSTDGESLVVNFNHRVIYHASYGLAEKDQGPDVCTNYNVSTGGGGGPSGSMCEDPHNSYDEIEVPVTYTIKLPQEDTPYNVCSEIRINPTNVDLQRTQEVFKTVYIGNGQYSQVHDYWIWGKSGESGSGLSRACVTVTRPKNPTNWPGTTVDLGSTAIPVTFAGEVIQPHWNINMKSHETRRYLGYQFVLFQIDHPAARNSGYYAGNQKFTVGNSGDDVCTYVRKPGQVLECKEYAGEFAVKSSGEQPRESHPYQTTPDDTGDKYCNSAGYKIGYYYRINGGAWQHEGEKDYWAIYPGACRTIAKKPSIAVWNGSLYSGNSVKTSVASRYSNARLGVGADSSQLAHYGSWAEYLANINSSIDGFASGSSRAIASGFGQLKMVSPLTIANTDENQIGRSGILRDSNYLAQLKHFFFEDNSGKVESIDSNLSAITLSKNTTRILKREGTLNITGNIITDTTIYDNIYEIPQVVIYATGDVNIDPNVTRIDAWIISDGTVNTCPSSLGGFEDGSTSSDAGTSTTPRTYGSSCRQQLVFNGPVIAKKLIARRSFGADPLTNITPPALANLSQNKLYVGPSGLYTGRSEAAEIFNLRADSFLWAYAQAGRYNSSYTEAYTRELAPRY